MSNLEKKLHKIRNVFDVNEILATKLGKQYIRKYYKVNQLAYSLLHTLSDRIYMGVSRDGVYKPKDLLEAANTVQHYIKQLEANTVLELATGRGANSYYLASKNPKVKFTGIDLSEGQLYFAKKKQRKVKNYIPEQGDYHNLSNIKSDSVDICFIVEALCYSTEKDIVLREVNRILKKGGIFIVFDGYYKKLDIINENQQLASKLTEIGMAVERFEEYDSFREKVINNDFMIIKEEDVSTYVLPTMKRFERLAKIYFAVPSISKIISKVLPKEFVYNALSGYLMPTLIEEKVASYMITIIKKS